MTFKNAVKTIFCTKNLIFFQQSYSVEEPNIILFFS